jgi:hypothetical protein
MPSFSKPTSPHANICEGSGSITAPILVSSHQQYGIEVIGPARGDVKWQANTEGGIDASQFHIDWDHQQAICPAGQRSINWTPAIDDRKNEVINTRVLHHRLQPLSAPGRLYPLGKEVEAAHPHRPTTGPT